MAPRRTIKITRLIGLRDVIESRTALERARWRCESCFSDSTLRVVEDRGERLIVLCLSCRLEAGWDQPLR
jgi:hypothetical protein